MTMTSAQPDGRFGALNVDKSNRVIDFKENRARTRGLMQVILFVNLRF